MEATGLNDETKPTMFEVTMSSSGTEKHSLEFQPKEAVSKEPRQSSGVAKDDRSTGSNGEAQPTMVEITMSGTETEKLSAESQSQKAVSDERRRSSGAVKHDKSSEDSRSQKSISLARSNKQDPRSPTVTAETASDHIDDTISAGGSLATEVLSEKPQPPGGQNHTANVDSGDECDCPVDSGGECSCPLDSDRECECPMDERYVGPPLPVPGTNQTVKEMLHKDPVEAAKMLKPHASRWNQQKLEVEGVQYSGLVKDGMAVEEFARSNLMDLDQCEKFLKEFEHAEICEADTNKLLSEALHLNRMLKSLESKKRNVEKVLYEAMMSYDRQQAREHREQEEELLQKERELKKRLKKEKMSDREKEAAREESLLRQRLLRPLEKAGLIKAMRYHTPARVILRLQDRPAWDNRFSYSHSDFNRPYYDIKRSMYRWCFADQGFSRKAARCEVWDMTGRPLFKPI